MSFVFLGALMTKKCGASIIANAVYLSPPLMPSLWCMGGGLKPLAAERFAIIVANIRFMIISADRNFQTVAPTAALRWMVNDMATMNPSKLRDILEKLPYSGFRESKQQAIRAIITKYLNGELVHVVRCKDCEYWMYEYDDVGLCAVDAPDTDGVERHAFDFCSCGERKDDAGNH